MRRALRICLLIAAAVGPPAAATPLRPADVAGAYHRHVDGAFVNGEMYLAEDVLEIVPTSPTAAYVRTRLNFGNGHLCELPGVIFDVVGPALVYRDPEPPAAGEKPCVLTLRTRGRRIEFDDGSETCKTYCGERGSWGGSGFPLSARRPITYMERLKRSSEYRAATGAPPPTAKPRL